MKDNKKNIIYNFILIPFAIITAYPFFFILNTSLKNDMEASFNLFGIVIEPTLSNFKYIFENLNIFRSFLNNLFLATTSVVFIVLFSAMIAYPVVFNKNKFGKLITTYMLIGLLVPTQALLLPMYKIMSTFDLIDTLYGIIFIYLSGTSLSFFLYRGYLRTIPHELYESAVIDGCSVWKVFWRIIFPLTKPISITVIILNIFWVWNDFINPYLFLNSPKNATLIIQINMTKTQFATQWGYGLAITTVTLVPLVIFYLFSQKFLIKGMIQGAIKG